MTRSSIYAFLVVLYGMLTLTHAGWEHYCSADDYQADPEAQSTCGPTLTNLVIDSCGKKKRSSAVSGTSVSGAGHLPFYKSPMRTDEVFKSKNQANSFFQVLKRTEYGQGIVCECCVNFCTTTELNEYCAKKRRRRRRSLSTRTDFNEMGDALVKEFYEKLDSMERPADMPLISIEEFESLPEVKLIEKQKAENIRRQKERINEKRFSEERSDGYADEYHHLSEYLKQKYPTALKNDQMPAMQNPSSNFAEPTLQESNGILFHKLMELFQGRVKK